MYKSIFKKKFFGYSPSDVTEYIEKINTQASNEIENAERSSGKLRDENLNLKEQIKSLTADLANIEVLENRIKELENEIAMLTEELNSSKSLLIESEETVSKLQSEYDALNVRYSSASDNNSTYIKTCQNAGNILLIAQSKSEEIVNEAQNNAEIIIENAKITAEETLSKATTEAKAYSSKVKAEADAYSVRVRSEADAHVDQSREKVDFLLKRQKQLIAALQSQKSEISKFYDETMSGFGSSASNK